MPDGTTVNGPANRQAFDKPEKSMPRRIVANPGHERVHPPTKDSIL